MESFSLGHIKSIKLNPVKNSKASRFEQIIIKFIDNALKEQFP